MRDLLVTPAERGLDWVSEADFSDDRASEELRRGLPTPSFLLVSTSESQFSRKSGANAEVVELGPGTALSRRGGYFGGWEGASTGVLGLQAGWAGTWDAGEDGIRQKTVWGTLKERHRCRGDLAGKLAAGRINWGLWGADSDGGSCWVDFCRASSSSSGVSMGI